MNRYVLGGILLGLVLVALSGLAGVNRLASSNDSQRRQLRDSPNNLGTLPIDQAGRVVRRQGDSAPAAPTAQSPTESFPQQSELSPDPASGQGSSFTAPGGSVPNAELRPASPNVIPQQSGNTVPSVSGDIDPVNPSLVRPEMSPPTTDPNLEPIPALW